MGTAQSQLEGVPVIEEVSSQGSVSSSSSNISTGIGMDQTGRQQLPPPPPLQSAVDSSRPPTFSQPNVQNMTPAVSYSQPYSHIRVNPVPGPPYHKIAQPMHHQSMAQQLPMSQFPTYSPQPYMPQPTFPPSMSSQSYMSPPQMSTSQQMAPGFSPNKSPQMMYPQQQQQQHQQYMQHYLPPKQQQSASPQAQQPAMSPSSPQNTVAPPVARTTTTGNIPNVDPYLPTPPSESAPSETSDAPPSSPEIKMKIKKTFTHGRPKLTSTLYEGEVTGATDRPNASVRNEIAASTGAQSASMPTASDESTEPLPVQSTSPQHSDPGVLPAVQHPPVAKKPLTLAQKKETVKAGKVAAATKPTAVKSPAPVYEEKPCEWLVGDLVWSKVSGHPWWPCMVAYDPNLGVYTRMKGSGLKNYRLYHVQFFGEVPERGWVSGTSMRKFTGKAQYQVLVEELGAKIKNRAERAKFLSKNTLKPAKRVAWEIAVQECERALPMSRHERKLNFTFKYEMPTSGEGVAQGEQIDVVSLGDSPKMKAKRAYKKRKADEEAAAAEGPTQSGDAAGSGNDSNSEFVTPPRTKRKYIKRKIKIKASPIDHISVADVLLADNKDTPKKRGRKPGFLIFYQKHKEQVKNEHPDYSDEQVVESLKQQWTAMSEKQKCRYKSKFAAGTSEDPTKAGKRKADDHGDQPPLKRSRRELRPSKKMQEADVENIGFSPEMTKALKISPQADNEKPTKIRDRKDSVEATLDNVIAAARIVAGVPEMSPDGTPMKKKRGRKPKIVKEMEAAAAAAAAADAVNAAGKPSTAMSPTNPSGEMPVKRKRGRPPGSVKKKNLEDRLKPPQKSITAEMTKDFAEMQEDENPLVIDTSIISDAIQSATNGNSENNDSECSNGNCSGSGNGCSTTSMTNGKNTSRTTGGGAGASRKENVCQVCERPGELLLCEGQCCGAFHLDCIGLQQMPSGVFKCDECISGVHSCFICTKCDIEVKRCSVALCGKFYHEDCLKKWTLTRFDGKGVTCPLHTCQACAADNPRNPKATKGRLTRCVRCPTAYHTGDNCIAAGSIVLASNAIVCSKHFQPVKTQKHHSHVNVSWCFMCSKGGSLMCCESCPAAFHPDCIGYDEIPDGSWYCRDCTNGKRPQYGDIVWVKLGNYRWWPAEVCHPRNIPLNIQERSHQVGEFPVHFFGSNDYYWTHRARVFHFQEGDKGSAERGCTKGLAAVFRQALKQANDKFQEWKKAKDLREAKDLHNSGKKPAPFKFIKTNKPVGKVVMQQCDISQCTPCECKADMKNPCGPDSDCLNRMLLIECHSQVCPAGDNCQNQRFQKMQYPETIPFRTDEKGRGWGLKTTQDIKKGDFVHEYVGELVDEETCRERIKKCQQLDIDNFYMLTIDKDHVIDAGPKGNLARFMNHSCDPNCETMKWTILPDTRVGLFAKRDITAGSELTFNYNLDCLGNEKKKCECGAKNCSGYIGVRPRSLPQEEKKQKKKKRKRKKKNNLEKHEHEDDCFRCGEGGELVMCDKKTCPKAYHVKCLGLSKRPYGKWECPWHHCDTCGKQSTKLCIDCPNSYCETHSNILTKHKGKLYCEEHDLDNISSEKDSSSDLNSKGDISSEESAKPSPNPSEHVESELNNE
uniref:Histone-lysine N-methyltransferase NSD2-like isoform X2 n=1 Tax=Saccoglossus kowalevskii TaxID=10224 RepID=A0ABM0LZ04_SACKO|nr:PREDICTED: histone-lysine N-methyltransferase NSD2-like isoform X2 [Saccoglossus kowalevskii]